jgi:hypothetical protein
MAQWRDGRWRNGATVAGAMARRSLAQWRDGRCRNAWPHRYRAVGFPALSGD